MRTRGHLPHWEGAHACYFVTFRLADSIPAEVAERIESERDSIIQTARQLGRELSLSEKRHIARVATIDKYLDNGAGACHLAKAEIAQIVSDALRYFDGQRYRLHAWCIMPNHVHVLLALTDGTELDSVLHSWKSFTAKKINRRLGVEGVFWQREYYDHLIRNDDDFERVVRYIAENPAKAGLKNWPWRRTP
ncbi:MAG TPA: transposase [Terriglobales bacterium]|nr:transposase [Terriglobales bacterium]